MVQEHGYGQLLGWSGGMGVVAGVVEAGIMYWLGNMFVFGGSEY